MFMSYSRKDFISKLIRAGLAMILMALAYFLGNKAVDGNGCFGCPGYGSCNGAADCNIYKK